MIRVEGRIQILTTDLLARFAGLTFRQFGPTLGDRHGRVETFIGLSTGNTVIALGFIAGALLAAGEQGSMIER